MAFDLCRTVSRIYGYNGQYTVSHPPLKPAKQNALFFRLDILAPVQVWPFAAVQIYPAYLSFISALLPFKMLLYKVELQLTIVS